MSKQPLKILISGAGVAGASLAWMLARHPSFTMQPEITVIERAPEPRTTGQAIDIRGRAVDVIRKLGLEAAIKERHTTETGTTFLNTKGKVLASIDATGDVEKQSATSEYEILRGDLAALLMDAIKDVQETGADLNIVYGERISAMKDLADGSGVDVTFANGKLEDQKYDVVIGADGIGSPTRSMIFGANDRREHVRPTGMYLGFFTIPRIAQDEDKWQWCTVAPGLGMHLRPHRNRKTMGAYLTITCPKKANNPELEQILHSDIKTQKAYLRRRFENVGWQSQRLLDGLDQADDFYMSQWCQVVTPQWAKGRCVILGDAAFATMGMGTSLAMIGAYCIAGELSKIDTRHDVPAALQRYEEKYRPYTKEYESSVPGFPQAFNPQSKWGVWMIHSLLRLMFALRIPQTLMSLFDGQKKEAWELPEYGW